MLHQINFLLIFTLLGLFVSTPTRAVESLSTRELASHCEYYSANPTGRDGIFCLRYIQGFIDGAVATDERVTLNVAAEYQKEETYAERAIRTRLGSRLNLYGPSFYAEFCLGAPVPLAAVVDYVVTSLKDGQSSGQPVSARDLVYTTLRKHHPCKADPADADS